MKNLIFSLLLLSMAVPLLSQPSDFQWLIYNGDGKSGYTTDSQYLNTLTAGQVLQIDGVDPPDFSKPNTRNDLFVIYADWTHYNSRRGVESTAMTPEFVRPTAATSAVTHHFNTGTLPRIQYLYLTNVYEGDDLPERPKVSSLSEPPASVPNTLSVTVPDSLISATHSIVNNKDYTLILKNTIGSNGLRPFSKGDLLHLTAVRNTSTNTIIPGHVLTTSGLFDGTSKPANVNLIPHSSGVAGIYHLGDDTDTLDYIYINLKPNGNLYRYLPLENNDIHEAIIRVSSRDGETTRAQRAEPILLSHDPNFIWLKRICQDPNGRLWLTYRVQFQNDGNYPAAGIKVNLELPEHIQPACPDKSVFVLGGTTITTATPPTHKTRNNSLQFSFPSNESLPPCPKDDPDACIGYVEFYATYNIGVKDTTYRRCDSEITFRPNSAEVIFDETAYPITEYVEPTSQDKDVCYRITEREKCPCKKPAFPTGPVIGAAAGVALMYAWMRRRKRPGSK